MKDQVARSFGAGYARLSDLKEEEAQSPLSRASQTDSAFCPECGQPLSLTHSRAAPGHRSVASWGSIFLLALGLFLMVAFGLNAWRATRTLQNMVVCADNGPAQVCAKLPHDLALALASGRIGNGDAIAARSAEQQLGHDVPFAAVGLVTCAIGLGAILLRANRSRLYRLAFAGDFWLGAEGLLTLLSGELVVICAYHLIQTTATGTPLTWDNVVGILDRTLSGFFALAGVW
jgi:hypothetical protein